MVMIKTAKNTRGFSVVELMLIIVVLSLLGFAGWYVYSKKHTPKPSNAGPLTSSLGSFKVVGNQIIEPNGKQFVPYGVVVECAGMKAPKQNLCTGNDATGNKGTDMVNAAAKDWNMNILRFQVAQENLFNSDGSVNNDYLNLIDGLVKQTNSLGMVATITLQEEEYSGPAFPTASATTFWQFMANHFKDNPDIFFDLYNEPRLTARAAGSTDNVWNIWQNGGSAFYATSENNVKTNKINYVGMQSLINTIRTQGAKNIVIAEGPNYDKDLSGVHTHQLTGGNVAYGVEPNPKENRTQTAAYKNFGQYIKTWPIVPEAFLDNYGSQSCDPNSPVDIPTLFSYLKSINMGLIFWSLNSGVGIVGKDLNHPTSQI